MNATISENVVLYDWLSFTSKKHSPQQLIHALGLDDLPWTETKGAHGYRDRLYYGCISIHYNGRDDMGVWVELSGQGCRNFEDMSTLSNPWEDIFSFIKRENCHLTRLDVAFDDHTGVLDIEQIAYDTEFQRFVSRMVYWQVIRSSEGTSCQIGSPQSKVLFRIYDKAAERGYSDGTHWVRVEMQLRDSRAEEFVKIPLPIGEAFAGVLLNYLRFVVEDPSDSNKRRWQMAPYWAALVESAHAISIYVAPGAEYNKEQLDKTVFEHWGNAIDAEIQMMGIDDFLTRLGVRTCRPNPKYEFIVNEHFAHMEAWANKMAEFLLNMDDDGDLNMEVSHA